MLLNLSMALMLWLVIGFLTGIKLIFVDEVLSKEHLDRVRDRVGFSESHYFVTGKKTVFLSICTLMGFLSMYYYIQGSINRREK
ncbi:hypothetical protein BEP19_15965 [Ammoniphilus oxalaticus]|uniref:Uncharacterized protein n=1 Tax=Ammoniphilus oxalaticus TaxID=66863 RepID=A0A419SQD3_9BACL|nr:hypothetical protein [Ammoniphilus oxalaticus]RKD26700.1 hypothetical protein BEP19_15965 [Ammoniphilus oxalaticus]